MSIKNYVVGGLIGAVVVGVGMHFCCRGESCHDAPPAPPDCTDERGLVKMLQGIGGPIPFQIKRSSGTPQSYGGQWAGAGNREEDDRRPGSKSPLTEHTERYSIEQFSFPGVYVAGNGTKEVHRWKAQAGFLQTPEPTGFGYYQRTWHLIAPGSSTPTEQPALGEVLGEPTSLGYDPLHNIPLGKYVIKSVINQGVVGTAILAVRRPAEATPGDADAVIETYCYSDTFFWPALAQVDDRDVQKHVFFAEWTDFSRSGTPDAIDPLPPLTTASAQDECALYGSGLKPARYYVSQPTMVGPDSDAPPVVAPPPAP